MDLNHSPRDFLPVEEGLREPVFSVPDVLSAVELVFQKEQFQWDIVYLKK